MLLTKGVVAQHAAVFIFGCCIGRGAAEGGDFEQVLAKHHVHDLEALADDEGAAEQAFDLLRGRIGCDIKILGLDAQQQVAHCTAYQEGFEAGLLQSAGDAHGIGGYQLGIDAMFFRSQYDSFTGIAVFLFGAEDATDKLFNH